MVPFGSPGNSPKSRSADIFEKLSSALRPLGHQLLHSMPLSGSCVVDHFQGAYHESKGAGSELADLRRLARQKLAKR